MSQPYPEVDITMLSSYPADVYPDRPVAQTPINGPLYPDKSSN